MPTRRTSRPVLRPNLGVYLGVSPLLVPERGLQACRNVRIVQGNIVRDNLGWSPWPNAAGQTNLDGKPVLFIGTFAPRLTPERVVLGNTTDLFTFDLSTDALEYLTPRVETGTATWTNASTTVTGQGTAWLSTVKLGDFFVGGAGQNLPTASWRRVQGVNSDTSITLDAAPADSGTTAAYTIRSVFTGDSRTQFSVEPFFLADLVGPGAPENSGDRLYAANGVDPIVAWDGLADQVYRPDFGDVDSAQALVRYRNILMFLAPTIGGTFRPGTIRSSAIGQPENTVSLEATEIVATDGVGKMLAGRPLGELLAIYSERGITLAQFVGPPLIFVFRTAVTGFGPQSGRALFAFSAQHLFVGPDTLYAFDGVNAQPTDAHVWRDVIGRLSPLRREFLHTIVDEARGELLWATPLASDADPLEGAPETAFTLHYLEAVGDRNPSAYTIRDFPSVAAGLVSGAAGGLTWDTAEGTWGVQSTRWNEQGSQPGAAVILFGDMSGNIWSLNTESGANGAPLPSFVRFPRRPLGDGTSRKGTIRRAYPFVAEQQGASHGLNVTVRTANAPDADAEVALAASYSLSDAQEPKFVPVRKSARYVEMEFGTTTTLLSWELLGYDLDIIRAGER